MAKPNYDFERRQRELAKKAKKEEKLRRRTGSDTDAEGDAPPDAEATTPPPADPAQ